MSAATISNIKCMAKVFELFFRYRLELSLSETVVQCEASEAQIKPILEKLTKREWLLFSKTKKTYRYGMKLLPFTREEILKAELVRQFTPIMKQLSIACNQSTMLHFLECIKSLCIQKIDSKNSIHIATRIGGESPLHAGSSSRVLLAYAPEAVRVSVMSSPLKRYTPFTITSPEELSKSLFEIRRTRCCSSIEEINPGAGSVSCAILDEGNNLLAALSIIGTRFACETEGALWKALLLEAVKKVKLA
ncbi:MAG: hypothetical protein LIO38_06390 [Cloacibacillus sp.]|nr:hypothetical protein [Cloacibacillus sp.]